MEAGANQRESDQPSYPDGVPNPYEFGFIPIGVAGARSMDHGEESIRAVCECLDRPVRFIDAKGYERGITAGAVHPEKGWIAWVEYRCKTRWDGWVNIEFRLKARVDDRDAINWIVETYNPFFGCRVGYLAWHHGRVVVIYREKHRTYACSLSATREKRVLVEMTDEWAVVGDQITFRSREPGFVESLSLPELRRRARISSTEARAAGVLPPDYDDANEANLQVQSTVKKKEKPRFWPF